MYDRSTFFWKLLQTVMSLLPKNANKGRDHRPSLLWVANQRFYRQMLLAAKVCMQQTQEGAWMLQLQAQSSSYPCTHVRGILLPTGPTLRRAVTQGG